MDGTATLSGIELRSSAQITVNETPDWHDWLYDEREYQSVIGSGGALTQADDQQSQTALGDLALAGDALVAPQGAEAVSQFGDIVLSGSGNVATNGVQVTTATGEVTASAQDATNATVGINGIALSVSLGTVFASGGSVQPANDGGAVYVRPQEVKDATAKLKTIRLVAVNGTVIAQGATVQDARATISEILVSSAISEIAAKGVLDIADDELLLLLAA